MVRGAGGAGRGSRADGSIGPRRASRRLEGPFAGGPRFGYHASRLVGFLVVCVLQATVTLLASSFLVFALIRTSGNPVDLILPAEATPAERQALIERIGFVSLFKLQGTNALGAPMSTLHREPDHNPCFDPTGFFGPGICAGYWFPWREGEMLLVVRLGPVENRDECASIEEELTGHDSRIRGCTPGAYWRGRGCRIPANR